MNPDTDFANCQDTTAAILAGGRGRRLGGVDKGLVALQGKPMIEYVLAGIAPQVGAVMISANRHRAEYASYGHPVVSDSLPDYQGPLAGMLSVLEQASTPFVLFLPCDGPIVPVDYCARMQASLGTHEVAVARSRQRLQPVYSLMRRTVADSLRHYLDAGERKIDLWYGAQRCVEVDFSDQPDAFLNINRPEDQAEVTQLMDGGSSC